MIEYLGKGLFGLLILISIIGIVIGAESPGYTVYVQGEQSTIESTTDGLYEITIQEIIPFSSIKDGDEYFLVPIKHLANESYPMNAVLILAGSEIDVTSLIEISNLSIDSELNTITFEAHPLEFYSGELLNPYFDELGDLELAIEKKTDLSALYLEINNQVAENAWSPPFQCCFEGPNGQCYMKC